MTNTTVAGTSANGPAYEIVEITPALAKEWLQANTHNRNLRERVVNGYAADMAAGQWVEDGQSIKFSRSGVLLDGQHRLSAIVLAGVTIRMLVVRNLPDSTQDTMDTGAKRTLADVLKLRGESNFTALAAILSAPTSGSRATGAPSRRPAAQPPPTASSWRCSKLTRNCAAPPRSPTASARARASREVRPDCATGCSSGSTRATAPTSSLASPTVSACRPTTRSMPCGVPSTTSRSTTTGRRTPTSPPWSSRPGTPSGRAAPCRSSHGRPAAPSLRPSLSRSSSEAGRPDQPSRPTPQSSTRLRRDP